MIRHHRLAAAALAGLFAAGALAATLSAAPPALADGHGGGRADRGGRWHDRGDGGQRASGPRFQDRNRDWHGRDDAYRARDERPERPGRPYGDRPGYGYAPGASYLTIGGTVGQSYFSFGTGF